MQSWKQLSNQCESAFPRSNLAFDPNFEKGCTAVAESVIAKTKKILSIKKVETKDTPKDTFKVRLLKMNH